LPISSTVWNGLPSNVSEEVVSAFFIAMFSTDSCARHNDGRHTAATTSRDIHLEIIVKSYPGGTSECFHFVMYLRSAYRETQVSHQYHYGRQARTSRAATSFSIPPFQPSSALPDRAGCLRAELTVRRGSCLPRAIPDRENLVLFAAGYKHQPRAPATAAGAYGGKLHLLYVRHRERIVGPFALKVRPWNSADDQIFVVAAEGFAGRKETADGLKDKGCVESKKQSGQQKMSTRAP